MSAGERWVRGLFPDEEAATAFDRLLGLCRELDGSFAAKRATSFDYAATSAPTPLTLAASALANLALPANANSVHQSGVAAQRVAANVREELAQIFMPPPAPRDRDWVAFTDGGSAANDLAFRTLPHQPLRLSADRKRDVVLVGAMEHPSVVARVGMLEQRGYKVVHFPCDTTGVYKVDEFGALATEYGDRVCLMTAHHVNNEVGTVQPIAELARVLRAQCPRAVFHVDCVQSFGRVRFDATTLGCDLMSVAFHKVGGPKRSGALVATRSGLLPARFRDTPDIATSIAAVAAAKDALAGLDEASANCARTRLALSQGVRSVCETVGVQYRELAPVESCVSSVLTLLFPGLQGRHLVTMLGESGFDLSAGAACAAQNEGPSHVLQAMRISRPDCFAALRLSISGQTQPSDTERLCDALTGVLKRLKPVQERELQQREYTTGERTGRGRRGGVKRKKSPAEKDSTFPPSAGQEPPAHRPRQEGSEGSPGSDADVPMEVEGVEAEGGSSSPPQKEQPPGVDHPPAAAPPQEGTPIRMPAEGLGERGYDGVMVCMGEVVLKGSNRHAFERQLIKNLKIKLASSPVTKDLYLWTPAGYPHAGFLLLLRLDESQIPKGGPSQCPKLQVPKPSKGIATSEYSELLVPMLREVSGIAQFVPVLLAEIEMPSIRKEGLRLLRHNLASVNTKVGPVTFGVTARRAKDNRGNGTKMGSEALQRTLGGDMAEAAEAEGIAMKVDLKNPQLFFEVRARSDTVIMFCRRDRVAPEGGGGLPDGSDGDGRVLCLLSGGHDSPVAAHKVMQRGCRVGFVHFDGYPFTGQEVVDKVQRLQQVLNRHQAKSQFLLVVPFSPVQEVIANTRGVCPSYRTVLYRVYFFRMACKLAAQWRFRALCTGDNLGQVASQTLANMAALDKHSDFMVLRPLLTWTKREIMDHAARIGTGELSAMHGTADCCTVFKPCNPVLHIDEQHLQRLLTRLSEAGIDSVVEESMKKVRVVKGEEAELVPNAPLDGGKEAQPPAPAVEPGAKPPAGQQ
eukprot:Hpha_TRINITY_DN15735_c1_g3::TRINITY_DN15735_c1_g3_i1::g.41939::m.41939/K03151/thiI; tRNA uracil 4-sulfurtransferase